MKGDLQVRPLSSFSPVIRPGKPGLIFIPALLALLAAAACGSRVYVVTSLNLPRAIVVDGDAGDWSGALSYVASDHLFVGFANDQDNLFVCLNREDEEEGLPGRSRRTGWTVWFDPAGGTEKAFGLRIAPTGGQPGEEPEDVRVEPGREGQAGRRPVGEQEGQAPSSERDVELQWIGSNGEVLRRLSPETASELGVEVGESRSGGSFVLEIKIPLRESQGHPFAIGAGPDSVIGVGFFSFRPERRDRRGGRPGGMEGGGGPGGGMPGGMGGAAGMGGRGGGMRGGLPPNMNPDIAKTVKVWTRVRLLRSDAPGRTKVLALIPE